MSQKERKRLVVLEQVKEKRLSLAKAAQVMGLCYRQARRVWQRYQAQGDDGLVHRGRGRVSNRRRPAQERERILQLYVQRYGDFGPTLAAEKLSVEGMVVDHETLRRWLLAEGHWTIRRRRQKHRKWRQRKACFGEMVQMDGSHHDWFEGRGPRAVLMVMIDDATNRTYAQLFEEETTRASFDMTEQWVRRYGVPQSLYVDRDSIYRCERLATVDEQLAQAEPQTQFGRAMKTLGVELILANSPQAKGRVERRNGLFQDRLVKELRLEGINEVTQANEYLRQRFLPDLNRRFTVPAASAADVHRPVSAQLDAVLSWEEPRTVQRDWTISYQGQWYQINQQHNVLSLAGKKVVVRQRRSGKVELVYRGQVLRAQKLPARPERPKTAPRRIGQLTITRPVDEHPWRRFGMASGRRYWRATAAAGQAARLRARDFGQPSLRSGQPPSRTRRRVTSSQ